MNTQRVLGIARHNRGIKGWCLNKTFIGRRIVTKALEKQYGELEEILPNGVRKLVEFKNTDKKPVEKVTYITPDTLKPCRTTIKTYDEEWNRTSLTSYGTDQNDKHRRTCTHITDFPAQGQRIYTYSVLRYNLDTYSWETENKTRRTFQKTADGEIKLK